MFYSHTHIDLFNWAFWFVRRTFCGFQLNWYSTIWYWCTSVYMYIVNGSAVPAFFPRRRKHFGMHFIWLYRLWAAIDIKKNFSSVLIAIIFATWTIFFFYFFLFLSPTSEMHQSIWLPIKCTILFPSIQLFTASVNPFSVQFVYDSSFFSLYFCLILSLDYAVSLRKCNQNCIR